MPIFIKELPCHSVPLCSHLNVWVLLKLKMKSNQQRTGVMRVSLWKVIMKFRALMSKIQRAAFPTPWEDIGKKREVTRHQVCHLNLGFSRHQHFNQCISILYEYPASSILRCCQKSSPKADKHLIRSNVMCGMSVLWFWHIITKHTTNVLPLV